MIAQIPSASGQISETIMDKLKELSASQQEEVLEFVEFLLYRQKPQQTIWDKIEERISQLPEDVITELPEDASENLDHYLYGVPKN